MKSSQPFELVLGSAVTDLSPIVKDHFLQSSGTRRYQGVMNRVWRRKGWQGWLAAIFLKIGSLTQTLFADTGADVPFELVNKVDYLPDGRMSMTWTRTFRFPTVIRKFDAVMLFDPKYEAIVDQLGKTRHLEAILHPHIDGNAMVLVSGLQWLRLGLLRVRVPSILAGRATVREWQQDNDKFGISVTIHNPLLGVFFGYEGSFKLVRNTGSEE
jgi:hypothetical protein